LIADEGAKGAGGTTDNDDKGVVGLEPFIALLGGEGGLVDA